MALPRVAFQGEPGAYSEAAALALWPEQIETVPCASFEQVYESVESGDCDYAMLPVENSLAGSIHRNYDLLLQHDLSIVAEHNQRIAHCLIAHPRVSLGEITRVYSHPQALAQCADSLRGLNGGVQVIAAQDTAGSVAMIKREGWRDAAAIAGDRAAELYEMAILQRDFEDEKNNYTRFIALAREGVTPESGDVKTSLAFAGHNVPGLLFKSLSAFSLRDIDLTKIESRPLRGVPWQYVFYLDFAGSMGELRCQRAVAQLQEMATFVQVFGSYPRAKAVWDEG